MCRLFGLSASPHRVRASFWLLEAPDALVRQSKKHPDGTGIGYFEADGQVVIDKEPLAAYDDPAFTREAKHVQSTTFVSHIRHATTGELTVENTHPFTADGFIFAHNGVIHGLADLERHLGDGMKLVHGDTDSERYFALIVTEIRKHDGDVAAGVAAATGWIADNLPLYSINFVLTRANDLWAFRYPETHRLFVFERSAGGHHGGRELHHVSSSLRVHVPELTDYRSVVVASEPLDDSEGWRLLEPGDLLHVGPDLEVGSLVVVDHPPAQLVEIHH